MCPNIVVFELNTQILHSEAERKGLISEVSLMNILVHSYRYAFFPVVSKQIQKVLS